MTVKTSWRGRIMVAALVGEIDILDDDGLAEALGNLSQSNADAVILDFSGVTYIASVGIGMLLRLAKELRSKDIPTRIAGASTAIRTILETVRIGSVLPLDSTVEDSIGKLLPVASA